MASKKAADKGDTKGDGTAPRLRGQHPPSCGCIICIQARRKAAKKDADGEDGEAGAEEAAAEGAGGDGQDDGEKGEGEEEVGDEEAGSEAGDGEDVDAAGAAAFDTPLPAAKAAASEDVAMDTGAAAELPAHTAATHMSAPMAAGTTHEAMDIDLPAPTEPNAAADAAAGTTAAEAPAQGADTAGEPAAPATPLPAAGAATLAAPATGAGTGAAAAATPAVDLPKMRVLSTGQASKLKERLVNLAALRSGLELLKPVWQEQPALQNRMGELPVWWGPEHEGQLVQAVLKHGFGEWKAVLADTLTTFSADMDKYVERVSDGWCCSKRVDSADGLLFGACCHPEHQHLNDLRSGALGLAHVGALPVQSNMLPWKHATHGSCPHRSRPGVLLQGRPRRGGPR